MGDEETVEETQSEAGEGQVANPVPKSPLETAYKKYSQMIRISLQFLLNIWVSTFATHVPRNPMSCFTQMSAEETLILINALQRLDIIKSTISEANYFKLSAQERDALDRAGVRVKVYTKAEVSAISEQIKQLQVMADSSIATSLREGGMLRPVPTSGLTK